MHCLMSNVTLTDVQDRAIQLITSVKFSLLYGGSRSGKTFLYILLMVYRATKVKSRHAILRYRFSHVKQSIVYDTFPKVCALLGIRHSLNKTDWFSTLPNGSEIWFGGLDDKERTDKILGNEYSTIFLNEASQISYDAFLTVITRLAEMALRVNRIFIDENPPSKAHWTYKLFIEGIEPISKTPVDRALYGILKLSPQDNAENLPDDYIELLDNLPTAKRRRFYLGNFADIVEGALWTEKLINKMRVFKAPSLIKTVVAVDPAITVNANSDETGIVVVGRDADGRGYLLNDSSGFYTPKQWGDKVVELYNRYDCDLAVGEKNQGGDMVRYTIETSDKKIPVKLVHASKGKILRAEPISVLYENDKISHVGTYPDLEEEMTTFTGDPGDISPNRLDALVWGFTHLMIGTRNIFFK